jgi:putative addiction module killer protein
VCHVPNRSAAGPPLFRKEAEAIRTCNARNGPCGIEHRVAYSLHWKIDFGPGYRVYFGQEGEAFVILLCGGDKGSQAADIAKAKAYWRDYREEGEHADA